MASKGWRRASTMSFALPLDAVVVGASELAVVAQSQPVAFTIQNGTWRAVAVLSPGDGRNRFVDVSTGRWIGAYVPAILRAYPFMLRTHNDRKDLALWPTAQSEPLGEGVEPFLVDGVPTETVKRTTAFLLEVHKDIESVEDPLDLLRHHEALKPWVPNGFDAPISINGAELLMLDLPAFEALPDDVFLQLRKLKALSWLYAHSGSLRHVKRFNSADTDNTMRARVAPLMPENAAQVGDVLAAIAEDLGDWEL